MRRSYVFRSGLCAGLGVVLATGLANAAPPNDNVPKPCALTAACPAGGSATGANAPAKDGPEPAPGAVERPPAPLKAGVDLSSEEVEKFGAATASFGSKVLAQAQGEGSDRTVLISPLSITAVLSLVAQGARGETAAQYAQGLGFDDAKLTLPQSAAAYAALARSLTADAGVTATLANGIWASKAIGLTPGFAAAQKSQFSAEIAEANFADPATLAAINAFVSKATQGKIATIIDRLPANSEVVVANALYFKGQWRDRFEVADTKLEPFTRADGSKVTAAMMHRSGPFSYAETPEFQAVALPYRDERFELVVLLPRSGAAKPDWLRAVQAARFARQDGQMSLPRLNLAYSSDILAALKAAGLAKALAAGGDYSALSSKPLQIGAVAHSTRLQVDEEGAEGAAATAAIGVRSLAPEHEPVSFRADRPFEIVLRERISGAVLFMGHVSEPGVGT